MLRIGTVGTSFITDQMLDAIALTENAECVAVSSRKRETARKLAGKHNITSIAVSLDELLSRNDIDTVYLASPNSLHVSQCLQAIAAGKNVICEKPLSVSEENARSVFNAATEKGVFVFEAISTLYMPGYIQCRESLKSIGRIHSISCRYTQRSSRLDAFLNGKQANVFDPAMQGGALNDLGVYAVYAVTGLLGSPDSVAYSPVSAANGVDIAGALSMRYPSLTANVFCAKDRNAGSGLCIDGESASVFQDGPLNSFSGCELRSSKGVQVLSPDGIPDAKRLSYELSVFRDAIQNNDKAFFDSAAEQSITVSRILEQARKSAVSGAAL